MTITAKVIAHSALHDRPDLITVQARYPRSIHAEAKTHRLIRIDDAECEFLQEISLVDDENLSRNASSSRAIPIWRMIQDVIDDPAMPEAWGRNQSGMQAGADLSADEIKRAKAEWLYARDDAVQSARRLADLGLHKQIVNRLIEPFGHISVVITATEWQNFFDLRCHEAADPTMRALAEAIRTAIRESTPFRPTITNSTEFWHLPYVTGEDMEAIWAMLGEGFPHSFVRAITLVSAARCARVSYLNHDRTKPDILKDLELAKTLLASKHMSPFEHQATLAQAHPSGGWFYEHLQGNLVGWNQFRKILEIAQ